MSPARPSLSYLTLCAATGAALATVGAAFPARAQDSARSSPAPAAQAPASNASMNLNAALARLGRNPRDTAALIDAGNAALAIGDVDAGIGFFSRANQVTPGNARIKAGLARALVHSGNPFDALPLFEEAERGGAMDSTVALDRGLAFDLVADNATAQSYYRLALTAGPNDEATRRLALSLAITGDKRGSAAALTPLLMRQDKAAWRMRAFALAILGQTDEAVAVVNTSLPAGLASGIAPYLRYMPRLTRSQQVAVANFGQFPRAAEIGQDDPRIARYAAATPRRPAIAASDAGLVPKGEPLGRSSAVRPAAQVPAPAPRPMVSPPQQVRRDPRTAPPEPQPARQTVPGPLASAPGTASPLATRPMALPQAAPVRAVSVPAASPPAAVPQAAAVRPPLAAQPAPASAMPAQAASLSRTFSLSPGPASVAAAPAQTVPAPTRAPVAQAFPAPQPVRRPSLTEAFSDLARPSIDVAPARGAVDIRRIKPAREVAATVAPIKPSHPTRIWVQLATGRDKSALGFDWRRMARDGAAVLKGKRAFVSAWGQTNRLLTGPFDSETAAGSVIAQLRRADIDGAFVWTSPAGQAVDAMPAR